jgi:hypothetical protein
MNAKPSEFLAPRVKAVTEALESYCQRKGLPKTAVERVTKTAIESLYSGATGHRALMVGQQYADILATRRTEPDDRDYLEPLHPGWRRDVVFLIAMAIVLVVYAIFKGAKP